MVFNINVGNPQGLSNAVDRLKKYKEGDDKIIAPNYYDDATRRMSYLNTPVFMPLEIKGGKYTDDSGRDVEYKGMFLDTVVLTVSQTKVIEETKIVGRNGTIKEYIADGDFEVSIKVLLASNNPHDLPIDAAKRLIALTRVPAPLSVTCDFLEMYEIKDIVVKSMSNQHQSAYQNKFSMDITALSHTPLEIRLIQEKK